MLGFTMPRLNENDLNTLQLSLTSNRNNVDEVPSMVSENPSVLMYASPELQNNPTIVLVAAKRNDPALKYAGPALQSDPKVVLAAVTEDGRALQFASHELQSDPNMILLALQNGAKYSDFKQALELFDAETIAYMHYVSGEATGEMNNIPNHYVMGNKHSKTRTIDYRYDEEIIKDTEAHAPEKASALKKILDSIYTQSLLIAQSILESDSESPSQKLMPARDIQRSLDEQEITWAEVIESIQRDQTLKTFRMHLSYNGFPSKNFMYSLDGKQALEAEDDYKDGRALSNKVNGVEYVLSALLFFQQQHPDVSLMVTLSKALAKFGQPLPPYFSESSPSSEVWNYLIQTAFDKKATNAGRVTDRVVDVTDAEDVAALGMATEAVHADTYHG
jgi:hypothetical protein